jgi:hypothetical protein
LEGSATGGTGSFDGEGYAFQSGIVSQQRGEVAWCEVR